MSKKRIFFIEAVLTHGVGHHLDSGWLREDFAMHMYMTGFPANKT